MSVDDIPINLSIATAHELAALMEQGRLTSTQLVTAYGKTPETDSDEKVR